MTIPSLLHSDAAALWQHGVAAGRLAVSIIGKLAARSLVPRRLSARLAPMAPSAQ